MYHDNLVFDLGMHHGEDTDYYLRKGYRVVAFEADPSSIALCQARFRREVTDGRLQIIAGAIMPEGGPEEVAFFINLHLAIWGSTEPEWVTRNNRLGRTSVEITTSRVDIVKAFHEFGMPYYLKIDVEGVDRYVLSTLQKMGDRPRYISIESEKNDFRALEADIEVLRAMGYSKFQIVQQGTVPGRQIHTTDISHCPFTYTFEPHSTGPFGDDLPARWLTAQETLKTYRRIFLTYQLFGDNSIFGRKIGKAVNLVGEVIHRPMPGWHDLHASLD